ncbi:LOW QUALITY PROTEIN: indole-3-glycerol phosphate synthase [Geomicrobium sp. JCM 19055]|nr:LOW QUALITY PROTEIN: indole-3-glycerol phosphate synthase [Geomicrobium sp. JCM 19055]
MLEQIIAKKRESIKTLPAQFERQEKPTRGFYQALKDGKEQTGVGLIAEIKRASPSKGDLALGMDILSQAKLYESGGADTISVLTDTPFFKGTNQDLQVVKAVTNIPVLRKDFIIDERQIFESASIGADAILLIAAVLDGKQIEAYTKIANDLGLDVLVEVHNLEELENVLAYSNPRLLGINNRDLKTFQTSLDVTEQLVKHIPKDCFVVSESGIHKKQDVEQIVQAGADAMLVGEHLVTNGSPTETIPQLKEGAIHANLR